MIVGNNGGLATERLLSERMNQINQQFNSYTDNDQESYTGNAAKAQAAAKSPLMKNQI